MILDDRIAEKIKVKNNLDRQNLESYQLNTLNNLITYAKQNSPFYRELYKNLDKINSLDELYQIPIISDKDMDKLEGKINQAIRKNIHIDREENDD